GRLLVGDDPLDLLGGLLGDDDVGRLRGVGLRGVFEAQRGLFGHGRHGSGISWLVMSCMISSGGDRTNETYRSHWSYQSYQPSNGPRPPRPAPRPPASAGSS